MTALLAVCLVAAPAWAADPEVQGSEPPSGSESEATPLPENLEPVEPPPPPSGAEQVRLETELPPMGDWFRSVKDDAKVQNVFENYGEHMAYNFTLGFAATLDSELLAENAQPVPYEELVFEIRQDYLFELVRVEGRLRRLTRMKPTDYLEKTGEIEQLYEAWIFPPEKQHPICVIVSELPEGLEPNQTGEVDAYVAAEGYFFKLMRYKSGEQKEDGAYVTRRAPLLLGKTLRVVPRPAIPPNPWLSAEFGLAMLAMAGLVIGSAVALLWWFTRTDRRMRAAVRRKQTENNPFDAAPAAYEPPPAPKSFDPYLN